MGYKYDEEKGFWIVSVSKRPSKNMAPVSRRREGIKSEKEAKTIEKELKKAVLDKIAELNKISGMNWKTLVEEFIDFNRRNGYQERTLNSLELGLNAHTVNKWGNKIIDSISTKDIYDLKDFGLKSAAIGNQKYILGAVRRTFQYGIDRGYLIKNPVPQFKFKKLEKFKPVLNQEQVRLFLNKAKELESEWYPHWVLAVYTGMRNGELYSLTWDKVDFATNRIFVNQSWNNKDGFKSTKSGDDRFVEMADGLLPILKELKLQSGGLDFVLPRLSKWDKGEQARELRMFLTGMGLPAIRFHDLRATWATLLLGRGMAPIKVMAMGGWKDFETMMIYIRKSGIDLKGCMDGVSFHEPQYVNAQIINLDFGSRL